MFDILLIFVAISLFAFSFYKWTTKNDEYFKDRNFPFMKPTFLLGNLGKFMLKQQTAHEFSDSLYYANTTKK